jgi:3-phosphoshikimate 1-carboxyvinyltransferase
MANINEKPIEAPATIDCHESGSTIRFLMPFFELSSAPVTFTGRGRLVERPYTTYYRIFDEKGIDYKTTEGLLPVTVSGDLPPGQYALEGNVSSQFITGLMLVLPLLKANSTIDITTHLESKGYVDLTLEALDAFGIEVENKAYERFEIKGNQTYKATDYFVEGDYSQAAFWLVAAAIGNGVSLGGMKWESLQGDRAILGILERMGAKVTYDHHDIQVDVDRLKGITIDASQCPDLVPVLAVLCSLSEGTSQIINAERLRIKESDRLKAISTELNKMGAAITETPDGLIIEGVSGFKGAQVDAWNDHRIAMAIAVASTRTEGNIELTGYDAVKKSYPMFWDDFAALGGKING